MGQPTGCNHRIGRQGILFAFIVLSGCAVHRSARHWHLVRQNVTHVLIPPDIVTPDLDERTFRADAASGCAHLSSDVRAVDVVKSGGKHARITVKRRALESKPNGWLGDWASKLEDSGCLAPGSGLKLASSIAESVPLGLNTGFGLMYADDKQSGIVDIDPQTRLKVLSPFWRAFGVGLIADGPYTITGKGYTLSITGKATDNLLGYERAIFEVRPKTAGVGYAIMPLYADQMVDGKTERKLVPVVNYFRFSSEAGFYRLYYESWRNDFTALVIAARTPAELDQFTKKLEASGSSASCHELKSEMCVAVPKDVAVTPLIVVTVNGREVLVSRGTTIFNAVRVSGESKPDSLLPSLSVNKLWNGRLIAIEFDRADTGILDLILRGGETISWKAR